MKRLTKSEYKEIKTALNYYLDYLTNKYFGRKMPKHIEKRWNKIRDLRDIISVL